MEHYGVVKCNVYSLYTTGGACYIIVTGKKKRLKLYTENGHKYVKNMYLKSPEQNTLKCK